MAPKGKSTAAVFQEQYGNLVSEHYAQYTTPYTLRMALSQRQPPIIVSDGMLKVWFAKYRLPSDVVTVSSVEELNRTYGDILLALAVQHPTSYRLMRALQTRTPPVYASDSMLRNWFLRYFNMEPVNSAAHLELKYGDRIRAHTAGATWDAAHLRVWLRTNLKVDAGENTCQTWCIRSWSTAGRLMSIYDIELSIGDRLRSQQYRELFAEELYDNLVVALSEGQPPVYLVEPFLLRQWYAKYHPDNGPIRISSALDLESRSSTVSLKRPAAAMKRTAGVVNRPVVSDDAVVSQGVPVRQKSYRVWTPRHGAAWGFVSQPKRYMR